MPGRYVHLVNADVDNAILSHLGIIKDDNETKVKLPKKCHICDMHNPPESSLCTKCGKPLDLKTALEAEEKLQAEQEQNRIEMQEVKKRIEELEYGAEARKAVYAKNMLRFTREKNRRGEVFMELWNYLFERSGTEEEKRQILKRMKEAIERGEKFDISWFEAPKDSKLENMTG